MNSAFQLLLSTARPDGSRSLQVVAETNNRVRCNRMTQAVEAIAGRSDTRRPTRRVLVTNVNAKRFSVFHQPDATFSVPRKGQIYDSMDALSAVIGSHTTAMRQALASARKLRGSHEATVRGITFSYFYD